MPSTVVVPGGATTVTFTVTSYPVAAGTSAVIAATYATTKSATLTVKAAALSTLVLAPTRLVGGTASRRPSA